MKDCNFEVMEVDGRRETMNLSERGKTVLGISLSGLSKNQMEPLF